MMLPLDCARFRPRHNMQCRSGSGRRTHAGGALTLIGVETPHVINQCSSGRHVDAPTIVIDPVAVSWDGLPSSTWDCGMPQVQKEHIAYGMSAE